MNHIESLHAAGTLILFEYFLGIFPLNPAFSSIILFVQAFDAFKIPESRASL